MRVVGIAGLIYALHLHQEISSLRSKMARIDWIGMSVFLTSATVLLYGLTTGGTAYPWDSANILAPLIIGIVGLGVFVVVELRIAKEPMMPVRIFWNLTANAGCFGAFIHGLVLWAFAYYTIVFVCGLRSCRDRIKVLTAISSWELEETSCSKVPKKCYLEGKCLIISRRPILTTPFASSVLPSHSQPSFAVFGWPKPFDFRK
jgi:hypothetical protein